MQWVKKNQQCHCANNYRYLRPVS